MLEAMLVIGAWWEVDKSEGRSLPKWSFRVHTAHVRATLGQGNVGQGRHLRRLLEVPDNCLIPNFHLHKQTYSH